MDSIFCVWPNPPSGTCASGVLRAHQLCVNAGHTAIPYATLPSAAPVPRTDWHMQPQEACPNTLCLSRVVRIAGWPISAQRPPTAHGVGFVVLEDETGRLPLAMAPGLAADLRGILRDARYLVAVGRLERVRWYRSLWAFELIGVTVNEENRRPNCIGDQYPVRCDAHTASSNASG